MTVQRASDDEPPDVSSTQPQTAGETERDRERQRERGREREYAVVVVCVCLCCACLCVWWGVKLILQTV
jgi:hypothetical protein